MGCDSILSDCVDGFLDPVQRTHQCGKLLCFVRMALVSNFVQSLSWTEGMVGLLARPRLDSPAPHHCYVAMCTVKDAEASLGSLETCAAISAIACYREVCEKSLSQFCGWKLTLGREHPTDKCRLLYGFHELSDALAWSIHTQHALLRAAWSDDLNQSHSSQTIFHRDDDGQWCELFAGLRVSIAVSQHTLTLRACLVRTPVPSRQRRVVLNAQNSKLRQ